MAFRRNKIRGRCAWACLGTAGQRGRLGKLLCAPLWLSGTSPHKPDLAGQRHLQNIPPNAESVARLRVKRAKKIGVRLILPACCISVSFLAPDQKAFGIFFFLLFPNNPQNCSSPFLTECAVYSYIIILCLNTKFTKILFKNTRRFALLGGRVCLISAEWPGGIISVCHEIHLGIRLG